jgi:ribose 5-phosphate isomerase B
MRLKVNISEEELHHLVAKVVSQILNSKGNGPIGMIEPNSTAVAPPDETARKKVIAIGADHGGFELKEILKKDITDLGYEIEDVGTHSKDAVDYPDYALKVATEVAGGKAWRGIMIDGAGIGSCIVANKVPGVRAGMAYDHTSAVNSREHNDTNVLTLGAGLTGIAQAKLITKTWLESDFGGGRHARRIEKIVSIERTYLK